MRKISWSVYGRTVHHLLIREVEHVKKLKEKYLHVLWDGEEVIKKIRSIDEQALDAAEWNDES